MQRQGGKAHITDVCRGVKTRLSSTHSSRSSFVFAAGTMMSTSYGVHNYFASLLLETLGALHWCQLCEDPPSTDAALHILQALARTAQVDSLCQSAPGGTIR
jgi:hypothetical protein